MPFSPVTDAVVLMAGSGSRLREAGADLPKPLIPVGGRPVISYALETLAGAGIRRLHAVVGAEAEVLVNGMLPLLPPSIELNVIENPEWEKQNGISLLAAAPHIGTPFVLLMADHLFDASILRTLVAEADSENVTLAVDSKIENIFDIDDAMKVVTANGRLREIGKQLTRYNAIDTGLFVCSAAIFDYLSRAKRNGDCSLADGIRVMAGDGRVCTIDIGDAWWQDVDTPEMLRHAETMLARRRALAEASAAPGAKGSLGGEGCGDQAKNKVGVQH